MPTIKRLVIPFLNVSTTLFEIPKWHLADDAYIAQIDDQDFATLHREAEAHYGDWLKARTICAHFDDPPEDLSEDQMRAFAILVGFVFNVFSSDRPMLLSKAASLAKHPECHHQLSVNLQSNAPVGPALLGAAYSIKPLENPEPMAAFFKVVRHVIKENPAVLVTLDRYNTSLIRSSLYDQIIDITISLESIVEASVEIKFRFSLYNALVAEPDPAKRWDVFKLLQTLYDARSAIVHGDIKSKANAKKIESTIARMKDIQRISVAAISYYLFYHFKDRKKAWRDHLDGLALGEVQRLTE